MTLSILPAEENDVPRFVEICEKSRLLRGSDSVHPDMLDMERDKLGELFKSNSAWIFKVCHHDRIIGYAASDAEENSKGNYRWIKSFYTLPSVCKPGRQLMEATLDGMRRNGGGFLNVNAYGKARGFYSHHGFASKGYGMRMQRHVKPIQ